MSIYVFFHNIHMNVYDCLALDDKLICSSSAAPSFPQLPIALCVGLRPHGLVTIQFGMFVSVFLKSCFDIPAAI